MVQKFQIKLQEKKQLSPNTDHFIFKAIGVEEFSFKPGQFISLHFEKDGKDLRRNYSLANVPNDENLIEFAMAYVPNGLASSTLTNLKLDEEITASGPYGQFVLKDEVLPKRYLLIGTGTGITPYRSMLPQLSDLINRTEVQIVILQGIRTREDLLYGTEFENFAKNNKNVIFKACFSREELNDLTEFEARGYVQDQLEALNIDSANDIAYLCGNPDMVDGAFQKLLDLGLDRAKIRREKYISSK